MLMGWAHCGEDTKGREIGYSVAATCDHPGCKAEIDRGLGYACGGMHGTDNHDCEGYFCGAHLTHRHDPDDERGKQFCLSCAERLEETKLAEYTEVLLASLVKHDKQAVYDLLVRWDETDGLMPDMAYMSEKDFKVVSRRQDNLAEWRALQKTEPPSDA